MEMDHMRNSYTEDNNQSKHSLESYLEGNSTMQDIILHGNLDRIKVGKKDPFMKEMVKSHKMAELMAELKVEYEIIMMDVPGVIETDYSINLSSMADYRIFVIGSSITIKSLIDESLRELEIAGVKINGIVLNRVLPVYIEDERIKLETERVKMHFFKNLFKK